MGHYEEMSKEEKICKDFEKSREEFKKIVEKYPEENIDINNSTFLFEDFGSYELHYLKDNNEYLYIDNYGQEKLSEEMTNRLNIIKKG